MFILILFALAHAQDCAGPYNDPQWLQELDAVSSSFAEADLDAAARKLFAIRERLPCLTAPADRGHLGRYARQLSLLYFFRQDEDPAIRWAELQRIAAPGLRWTDPGLPLLPAYQEILLGLEPYPKAGDPTLGLAIPKRGTAYLSGTPIGKAVAHVEVPGLLQFFDKKGRSVWAGWQDGVRFPDQRVVPGKPTAPTWASPPTHYEAVEFPGADPYGFGIEVEAPLVRRRPPKRPPVTLSRELLPTIARFPEVRVANLQRIGERPGTTPEIGLVMKTDPDTSVRQAAFDLLLQRLDKNLGDPTAAQRELEWVLAFGPSRIQKRQALQALGTHGTDIDLVAAYLDHAHVALRRGAIAGLVAYRAAHPQETTAIDELLTTRRKLESHSAVQRDLEQALQP